MSGSTSFLPPLVVNHTGNCGRATLSGYGCLCPALRQANPIVRTRHGTCFRKKPNDQGPNPGGRTKPLDQYDCLLLDLVWKDPDKILGGAAETALPGPASANVIQDTKGHNGHRIVSSRSR